MFNFPGVENNTPTLCRKLFLSLLLCFQRVSTETGFYLCPFRVTILVKQTTNIRKLNGTQKFPVQFAKWNLKLQRYVMYSVFQFRIQKRNKTLCLCSKIRNTNVCPLVKFKCWYQMFRSFIVEGNKKISLNFCYKFQLCAINLHNLTLCN